MCVAGSTVVPFECNDVSTCLDGFENPPTFAQCESPTGADHPHHTLPPSPQADERFYAAVVCGWWGCAGEAWPRWQGVSSSWALARVVARDWRAAAALARTRTRMHTQTSGSIISIILNTHPDDVSGGLRYAGASLAALLTAAEPNWRSR